jgi:putative SOS response-associated peptidase YedK
MCGRFIQSTGGQHLAERFGLPTAPALTPRYNVAPSQSVQAIRMKEPSQREAVALRWGLIPAWSPEPRTAYSTINARAESMADKPTYRQAFRQRRCLIPADGFYEWRKVGSRKQPYCIAPADGRPLAFAGLWERWERDGQVVESCTILVTAANTLIAPIHDRMPVILDLTAETRWLDPTVTDPAALHPLWVPCPSERLRLWPVSSQVNNPRHEGPALWMPLATPVS